MALQWQTPNYFLNQFPSFEHQPFHHFQPQHDSPSLETELLCFDPLPPSLFDFHDHPPFQQPDFINNHDDHQDFTTPNNSPFYSLDFPPHMLLPTEEHISYDEDYSTQFLPFPNKRQKVASAASLPCFFNDSFSPDLFAVSQFNTQTINNPNHCHHHHYDGGGGYFGGANYSFNQGCDYTNYNDYEHNNKVSKVVSAQSKAARERRRKITEKTQELGKLIPGGHKMNTAEMLEAASTYVKFMQAQLGILQSLNSLPLDEVKEAKLNNLPILTSPLVQEKLYAKDKCLVPLDFLPILEEHCDYETNPSITQHIRDLLH